VLCNKQKILHIQSPEHSHKTITHSFFSSPGQRPCELLSSLGVRRPSVVSQKNPDYILPCSCSKNLSSFRFIIKQQWTIEEISIFSNSSLEQLCATPPFSINFRCQIENQVSDYRLLRASSF
jgi:hypothetical protein